MVVSTEKNRGDLFTKALAGPRLTLLSQRIGMRFHGKPEHVNEALVAAALVQEVADEAANQIFMNGMRNTLSQG